MMSIERYIVYIYYACLLAADLIDYVVIFWEPYLIGIKPFSSLSFLFALVPLWHCILLATAVFRLIFTHNLALPYILLSACAARVCSICCRSFHSYLSVAMILSRLSLSSSFLCSSHRDYHEAHELFAEQMPIIYRSTLRSRLHL